MGVRQQQREEEEGDDWGIDALTEDPKPKQLSERPSGSLVGTIPEILTSNAEIDSSETVQYLAHNGNYPVVVDEACVIIRKHPEAGDN